MLKYDDLLGKRFEYGAEGPDNFDCFNLAREIYKRIGIELPQYAHPSEASLISQVVMEGKQLFEELEKPEPYCLALFMVKPPYVTHIGVVLEDSNRFIHIMEKCSVCVERLDSLQWNRKIRGYYRYKTCTSGPDRLSITGTAIQGQQR